MANKHLTEDQVSLIVNVESSKAQQEIKKLENKLMGLKTVNKQQLKSMVEMEAAGRKNTKEYISINILTCIINVFEAVRLCPITISVISRISEDHIRERISRRSKISGVSHHDNIFRFNTSSN